MTAKMLLIALALVVVVLSPASACIVESVGEVKKTFDPFSGNLTAVAYDAVSGECP